MFIFYSAFGALPACLALSCFGELSGQTNTLSRGARPDGAEHARCCRGDRGADRCMSALRHSRRLPPLLKKSAASRAKTAQIPDRLDRVVARQQ
jgi:hypothetical protein